MQHVVDHSGLHRPFVRSLGSASGVRAWALGFRVWGIRTFGGLRVDWFSRGYGCRTSGFRASRV